jgi:acyl CoA:acetate/3-ketoacid CoA transferase alpha subunit
MDPEAQAALHKQMQAGDLRLPFVVCTNGRGEGVYADGNYRIRMAQTLLEILRCQ